MSGVRCFGGVQEFVGWFESVRGCTDSGSLVRLRASLLGLSDDLGRACRLLGSGRDRLSSR